MHTHVSPMHIFAHNPHTYPPISIRKCIRTRSCLFVCGCMYTHLHRYVFLCVFICVYMYIFVHSYMYICVYLCVHIYMCMCVHTCVHNQHFESVATDSTNSVSSSLIHTCIYKGRVEYFFPTPMPKPP